MMASDALFALNGGCGYVLRPPLLDKSRRPLAAAIAERAAADPADAPLLLTLRLLSAHNLDLLRCSAQEDLLGCWREVLAWSQQWL